MERIQVKLKLLTGSVGKFRKGDRVTINLPEGQSRLDELLRVGRWERKDVILSPIRQTPEETEEVHQEVHEVSVDEVFSKLHEISVSVDEAFSKHMAKREAAKLEKAAADVVSEPIVSSPEDVDDDIDQMAMEMFEELESPGEPAKSGAVQETQELETQDDLTKTQLSRKRKSELIMLAQQQGIIPLQDFQDMTRPEIIDLILESQEE